jgi:hypothetical protein
MARAGGAGVSARLPLALGGRPQQLLYMAAWLSSNVTSRQTVLMPTTVSDYVAMAEARILEVLAEHFAVVPPEIESRIAERYWQGSNGNIDPHHITSALRNLGNASIIEWSRGNVTRGGRRIDTIQLADRTRRATKIDRASARKRLVYSRYTSWAQGTQRFPHGLIGPAGEVAMRSALIASGALQPAVPGAGETKTILGVTLPGALDSAGYIVPVVRGLPQDPVTTIFEVKNIRSWIYPSSAELYQLLDKAVLLQQSNPKQSILPIMVCRRAHRTTFWMAKQLGFFVIEMGRQFAGAVDEKALLTVRNELHFNDLYAGTGPSIRVTERMQGSIPKQAADAAEQWRATTNDLGATIRALRRVVKWKDRQVMMQLLREESLQRGDRGGW